MAVSLEIPFIYVDKRVREHLAHFMEYEENWKFIAERMGFETRHINWIGNCEGVCGSKVLRFFEHCERKKSVEEMLAALNHDDFRAAYTVLADAYPGIKSDYLEEKAKLKEPSSPMDVDPYPPIDSPKPSLSATTGRSEEHYNTFPRPTIKPRDENSMNNNRKMDDNARYNRAMSAVYPLQSCPFQQVKCRSRVFVTFYRESKPYTRSVLKMCQCLHDNKFCVRCDQLIEKVVGDNDCCQWIHDKYSMADFILVLISPNYTRLVADVGNQNVNGSNKNFYTTYVYKLMQAEHYHKSSSRRIIPVLMDGAEQRHVPSFLRGYKHYCWPRDYKNLFFYMAKPDECVRNSVTQHRSLQNPSNVAEPSLIHRSI